MGEQFEKSATLSEIDKSNRQCKRGVSRKAGVMDAYIHGLSFDRNLLDDIVAGTYKLRPGKIVTIHRPKKRQAIAPYYRDRVWQRTMCNNGIYDDLMRSCIYDNLACQKGKGTDIAIRRVIMFLQRLYREDPNAPIYGKHLDIKKYFPSTPQAEVKKLDREKVTEPAFIPYLDEIIDSVQDPRPAEVIEADPHGKRGTGLGSQINQLNQIALLDQLDHDLKCFCRNYAKYNDDFLILDHDREIVERAGDLTNRHLAERGLTMVDKAGTFDVQKCGFYFLRKRFIMTKTGKIVIRLHRNALKEERKTLLGLKRLLDRKVITMKTVRMHYQSWIAQAEYAGDAAIRSMDRFYIKTFREKPVYKRKRRYLYGKRTPDRRKPEEKDAKGGKGKQTAAC